MLTASEEHRKVFPGPPLISFKHCKNFMSILVRAKLYWVGEGDVNKRDYTPCGKSRCVVCDLLLDPIVLIRNIK